MKINKRIARKLFNDGKEFWITPCNMRKECGILINAKCYTDLTFDSFDAMVNAFEYYNCNSETGRYAAFYTDLT